MKLPYSKESDIVIKEANRVARKLGQNFVGSESIYRYTGISVADTTAYGILNENGLDIVKINRCVEVYIGTWWSSHRERDKYTMSAKEDFSMTHSMRQKTQFPEEVGTEHILLALIKGNRKLCSWQSLWHQRM